MVRNIINGNVYGMLRLKSIISNEKVVTHLRVTISREAKIMINLVVKYKNTKDIEDSKLLLVICYRIKFIK